MSTTKETVRNTNVRSSLRKINKSTTSAIPYVKTFANERVIHLHGLRKTQTSMQTSTGKNGIKAAHLKETSRNSLTPETEEHHQKSLNTVKNEVGIQTDNIQDDKLESRKQENGSINAGATYSPHKDRLFKLSEETKKNDVSKTLDEFINSAVNFVDNHIPISSHNVTKKNHRALFDIVKPSSVTHYQPSHPVASQNIIDSINPPISTLGVKNTSTNSFRGKEIIASRNQNESTPRDLFVDAPVSDAYQLIKDLENDLQNLQDEAVELVKKKTQNKNTSSGMTAAKNKTSTNSSLFISDHPIEVFFPKREKTSIETKQKKLSSDDLEQFHKLLQEIQDRQRMLNDNLERNVHDHHSEELNKIFDLVKDDPNSFKQKMYIRQKVDEYILSMKPQIMTEVSHRLHKIQLNYPFEKKDTASKQYENLNVHSKTVKPDPRNSTIAKKNIVKHQVTQNRNIGKNVSRLKNKQPVSSATSAFSKKFAETEKMKNKNIPLTNKSKVIHKLDSDPNSQIRPLSSPAKQIRDPWPYFHLQNSVPHSVVAWPPVKKSVTFQNKDSHATDLSSASPYSVKCKTNNLPKDLNKTNLNVKSLSDLHAYRKNTFKINKSISLVHDDNSSQEKHPKELNSNFEILKEVSYESEIKEEPSVHTNTPLIKKNDVLNKIVEGNTNEIEDVFNHMQTSPSVSVTEILPKEDLVSEEMHLPEVNIHERSELNIIIDNKETLVDVENDNDEEMNLNSHEDILEKKEDNIVNVSLENLILEKTVGEQTNLIKTNSIKNKFSDDYKNCVDVLAAGDMPGNIFFKNSLENLNSKEDHVLSKEFDEKENSPLQENVEYKICRKSENTLITGSGVDDSKTKSMRLQQINNISTSDSLLLKVMLSPTVQNVEHQWKTQYSNSRNPHSIKHLENVQAEDYLSPITEHNYETAEELNQSRTYFEKQSISPQLELIATIDNCESDPEANDVHKILHMQNLNQMVLDTKEISNSSSEDEKLESEEISIITQEITEDDKNYIKAVQYYEKHLAQINNVQNTLIPEKKLTSEFNSLKTIAGFDITGEGERLLSIINEESSVNSDKTQEEQHDNIDELLPSKTGFRFASFNSMEKEIKKSSNYKTLSHVRKKPPPSSQILLPSETSSQKLFRLAHNWIGQELLARSLSLLVPHSSSQSHLQVNNSQYRTTLLNHSASAHKNYAEEVGEDALKSILLEILNEKALNIIRDKNNFKPRKFQIDDKTKILSPAKITSQKVLASEEGTKPESPEYDDDYDESQSSVLSTPLPTPTTSPETSVSEKKNKSIENIKIATPAPSLNSPDSDNDEKLHGSRDFVPLRESVAANEEHYNKEKTPVCTPSPQKEKKDEVSLPYETSLNIRSPSPSLVEDEEIIEAVVRAPTVNMVEQATQVSSHESYIVKHVGTSQEENAARNINEVKKTKEIQTNRVAMLDVATSPVNQNITESPTENFTMISLSTTLSEGEWRPQILNKIQGKIIQNVENLSMNLDNTLMDIEDLERDLYSEGEIHFHHPVNKAKKHDSKNSSKYLQERKDLKITTDDEKYLEPLMTMEKTCSPGEIKTGFLVPSHSMNNQAAISPGEKHIIGLTANNPTENLDDSFRPVSIFENKEEEQNLGTGITSIEDDFQTLRNILTSINEHSLTERQTTVSESNVFSKQGTTLLKTNRLKTVAFKEPHLDGQDLESNQESSLQINKDNNENETDHPVEVNVHSNVHSLSTSESEENSNVALETTHHSQSLNNSYSEGEIIL